MFKIELLTSGIVAVVAGVVTHILCKWLDSKRNR